jgi:hypothetical protein
MTMIPTMRTLMLLAEAAPVDHDETYLVRNKSFERCQSGGGAMRTFSGEAGNGVYAYPVSSRKSMRPYYTSQGETVYLLRMKSDAIMVDLTLPGIMADLLAYGRSRIEDRTKDMDNYPHYQPPKLSASNIQRFGGLIEGFIHHRFANVRISGWIVPHKGPGLPTGKQAVITRIEDFDVSVSSVQTGLTESFDHPLPYHWQGRNRLVQQANFAVEDKHYRVMFWKVDDPRIKNAWSVEFSLAARERWQVHQTGTGNAHQVFATVLAVIREFVTRVNPQQIRFSATHENRKNLYLRLANRMPGYTVTDVVPDTHGTLPSWKIVVMGTQ